MENDSSFPLPTVQTAAPPDRTLGERIKRVEKGLVVVTFDGALVPAWEKTQPLAERMSHYRVPGISVAVINDFEIEWAKGYGVLRARDDNPVTPATIFEAASTSKTVTAATALHFVERDLLDLDADVNEKLVSWKIPENEFTVEHRVTLRRLLSHTAGLNRPPGGFAMEGEGIPSTAQVLNGELPAKNLPATVEYVPGTDHSYSNFGYVTVQQLLEDVVRKPFGEIVREAVLEPIGMQSSTFEHPLPEKLRGVTAVPHNVEGEPEEWAFHPTALGQVGLWTTPSDLARFAVEIMESRRGRSNRVLTQATVDLMLGPEVQLDPEKWFGFSGQGLGFFLMGGGQEFYFAHPGENAPGATCMFIAVPETGQGAVIMTNGMNGSLLQYETMLSIAVEYGWSIGGADAKREV